MSNALQFPFVAYQTQNQFDDYNADDMRYGDLSEYKLRTQFRLDFITSGIDPWGGETWLAPGESHGFAAGAMITKKYDRYAISNMLFEAFRKCTFPVSFMGYRKLFLELIAHFKGGYGAHFHHKLLDEAYYDQVLSDTSDDSSLLAIQKVIDDGINWGKEIFPDSKKETFRSEIADTVLPKFNRWQDSINGLSMSVHDVYATRITIEYLHIDRNSWRAIVHYKGQDHFGLDRNDIMSLRFHNIPIFRIWFILQRWDKLAYHPFMTNFEATFELKGVRKK